MHKPKVLFTFIEAGMGHIIPETAVCDAFTEKYGDKCEIIRSYILNESSSESVKKMGAEQIGHTKRLASNVLYNKLEAISYALGRRFTHFVLKTHFKKGFKDLAEDFGKIKPDLIFSTYYLPSLVMANANEKGLTDCVIATYSPDPYIYPAWDKRADAFIVNNDGAYEWAKKRGFSEKQIRRVPLVVRKKIVDAKPLKKQNNGGRLTVLFSMGAYGFKGCEKYAEKLLEKDLPIDAIFIAGKNEAVYNALVPYEKRSYKNTRFELVGFTDKMDEYLLRADIIIGKGGSNSLAEAICTGVPTIVCAEANRLEELTAAYWEKRGVVIRERNADKVAAIVERAATDGEYLKKLKAATEEFSAEGDGANVCADELFGLLKGKFKDLR